MYLRVILRNAAHQFDLNVTFACNNLTKLVVIVIVYDRWYNMDWKHNINVFFVYITWEKYIERYYEFWDEQMQLISFFFNWNFLISDLQKSVWGYWRRNCVCVCVQVCASLTCEHKSG